MRIVILLSILTLGLNACAPVGDFCDVALDLRQEADLAAYSFDADETWARDLAAHNTMYLRCP
jgi:hypothetical protein